MGSNCFGCRQRIIIFSLQHTYILIPIGTYILSNENIFIRYEKIEYLIRRVVAHKAG